MNRPHASVLQTQVGPDVGVQTTMECRTVCGTALLNRLSRVLRAVDEVLPCERAGWEERNVRERLPEAVEEAEDVVVCAGEVQGVEDLVRTSKNRSGRATKTRLA